MSEEPLPPPTRRKTHGYKYTPKQEAEKESYVKQLIRDYPDVPPLYCEWVVDYCLNTPQEELDEIMASGRLDDPGKFSQANVEKMLHSFQTTQE